ncbi:MAG: endonuclease/exonuclease/phosphatase family protein [Syntrophomonadaceae bacterium]|nr:endonuclease/exonuclease/phosphatase family protein [Syntrophomonadaceae bacterium]MDD3023940.1 endonuclease/exonuclease/phosphatase family protein [Syntrophomonadaceae bacterium]
MQKLRIASYNIQHGKGMDGVLDLKRTSQVLSQMDADVIFLQEVDMFRMPTHLVMQVQRLAFDLGMSWIYGSVRSYPIGSYGNGILSRYPIVKIANHILPDAIDPRRCLQAEIMIKGTLLAVFNTHLGLKQDVRLQQVQNVILPLVLSIPGPSILGGDFNATVNRPETRLLAENLTDTFCKNSGPQTNTFPAIKPAARIDYIFTNHQCMPSNYFIMDSMASDHLPITAEIEIL